MIDDLNPYPSMKDSGLPWVGEVPAHWPLVPNRAMLRRRKVLVGDRHSEHQLLSLTKAGVIVRDVSTGRGKFSADMGTSQEVRVGDLVCCLFDVPETPRTVGLSEHKGMITGAYTVFEGRDSQQVRFLEAFYIAMDDRKLLSPLYSGLRNTIPPSVFLGVKTPLPPLAEQAAIVRFLDYADRQIRRYIRAKQKLIKLLEEQKQAIIHQAVTRGLNPDVSLKPSGVEWLGDVPEHWDVVKLARVIRSSNAGEVIDKGWWGRGTEVLWTCARSPLKSDYKGFPEAKRTTGNDLLLTRNGTPYVHRPAAGAIYSNVVQRVNLVADTNREWVARALEAATRSMKGYGVSIESLNYNMWKVLALVTPPGQEQTKILEYIDRATAPLGDAIAVAGRGISLLEEYRTRLTSDVVTGKLDVRETSAQGPDEPEPVDEGDSDSQQEGASECGHDPVLEGCEE